MIIDTHCHFDMMGEPERYIRDIEGSGNIVIGMTNLPSHFQMGVPFVRAYKRVRLALGLHPLLAKEGKDEAGLFEALADNTSYIGEIGLDYSREGIATKEDQVAVLHKLLSVLRGKKKIVSVHSRRAERELLDLLREYEIENVIFHWYSGAVSLIPSIIEQGYYFSVNENMCVSKNGRSILERIPQERVLTETDAPYNERCDIRKTLDELAIRWNMSKNEAEQTVERNFRMMMKRLG